MPNPDDNLESRVTNLERDVAQLREQTTLASTDAATARVLAADVAEVRAELRAHTQVLNALREGQLELRETVVEQGQRMSDGFSTLNVGMAQITALLNGIVGERRD